MSSHPSLSSPHPCHVFHVAHRPPGGYNQQAPSEVIGGISAWLDGAVSSVNRAAVTFEPALRPRTTPPPAQDERVGLVLVDRNTVPIASCDILVSFAAHPCELDAHCVYLHPTHNFSLLQYDVHSLTPAAAAAIVPLVLVDAAQRAPARGDQVRTLTSRVSRREGPALRLA
jgi:hypothetical protein